MDPEEVWRRDEIDKSGVLEGRLVTLEVALEVDRQDDAHGQHGDDEQVAYDVRWNLKLVFELIKISRSSASGSMWCQITKV